MSANIDIVGKKFGLLTVIRKADRAKYARQKWECKCECGKVSLVPKERLTDGRTKSCGCLRLAVTAKSKTTHGMYKTNEYRIWAGIINRCYNSHDHSFLKYGSKGITMCDEWRNSFLSFYGSMGKRPSKNHSIDRIDNSGNYEPSNCRWATVREQSNNRVSNVWITFNGERLTASQWAERLGFSFGGFKRRIARMGYDAAISAPRDRIYKGRIKMMKGVGK